MERSEQAHEGHGTGRGRGRDGRRGEVRAGRRGGREREGVHCGTRHLQAVEPRRQNSYATARGDPDTSPTPDKVHTERDQVLQRISFG